MQEVNNCKSNVEICRIRDCRGEGPHLVLLPLQSLRVVELLGLQLAHPLMQLVDLIPAGKHRSALSK